MALSPVTSNAQSKASGAFEKLKTLAGTWETKSPEGVVPITYEVTANGSAVVETIGVHNTKMVSVFHLDNDRILMTHYCALGNQPRMAATPAQGEVRELAFDFVDASNMKSAEAPIMKSLRMTFIDADHVNNTWTYCAAGKHEPHTFELVRKK